MSNLISRIKIPLYNSQLTRVEQSIRKGELVHGSDLVLLENRLKQLFNRKYVLLTSNGFSAIFLTLLALKPKNKEVILPAISTCFSMVNAAKMAGYNIHFSDVDIESMGLGNIEKSTSVVLSPNHFGKIALFNKTKISNSFVIEDSCQAFFSNKNIKSNTDVTVLSFYPSKIINGIDGGAILTDNKDIYQEAKSMIYYSKQEKFEEKGAFNMRLNNINASFLLATMEHLDELERKLKNIYKEITDELKRKNINFLEMDNNEVASKLILRFANKEVRDFSFKYFIKNDIEVSLELRLIAPINEYKQYKNATSLIDTTLSLPFHPLLTDNELMKIKQYIKDL